MLSIDCLNRHQTDDLLDGSGLAVGKWNSIRRKSDSKETIFQWHPPANDLHTCIVCMRMFNLLHMTDWFLLHLDYSTSPLDFETDEMSGLLGTDTGGWSVEKCRSLLFRCRSAEPKIRCIAGAVSLKLIQWQWHTYIVTSDQSCRLAIQDGAVYFYVENPRRLESDWFFDEFREIQPT